MVKPTMNPWVLSAEIALAVVAMVVEVMKKQERGRS